MLPCRNIASFAWIVAAGMLTSLHKSSQWDHNEHHLVLLCLVLLFQLMNFHVAFHQWIAVSLGEDIGNDLEQLKIEN